MSPSAEIQLNPPAAAKGDRTLPYAIALLLLPVLVLWHRDDPLFSPPWQADPWFYLGYFRDLVNFKRHLFPDFYYGSRMSWILPGYVLHSLLSPVVANAVLHLTTQSVTTLSFFFILRWTIGLRSAYLATVAFSLHPWLWCATGWDHVNGGVIAYFLLAMALLTRAALRPHRNSSLLLAGMALAGCIFAHLFLVAFVPLLLIYYLGLSTKWVSNQMEPELFRLAGWIGLGFIVFTIPLSIVNLLVDGNPWFWSPSLTKAQAVMQNYAWSESIWSDQELVPWLWFVVAGTALALLLLPSYFRTRTHGISSPGLLFSAQLLLATGLMAYLQSRGVTLLGHYYYACYLLPFVFLVFGASLWPAVEKMSRPASLVTCGLATLLFGALWYDPTRPLIPGWRAPEWAELLFAGTLLAVALLFRQRMAGTFAAIAGLAVLTSLVYTGNYRGVDLHGTHEQYLRIMNARQHIENQRKGAPILFWYDKQEMPDYFEYYALNASYLAEFSRISENFPRGCSGPVEPGTLVVVTSEQEHSADLAQTALTDCWRPFGVRPTVASVEAIRADRRTYTMTMLKVEPAASTMPAPGESFKSVPLEQMKLGDPHVVLRSTPEGIELQTLRGFGAFAGRVKLRLDSSLPEKLAVLVRLRVIDGKVFVGILNTKSNGFLVNTPVWPLPRDLDVILPLPSPPVTGDLIISNARPNKLISKVLVEKIEIRQLP